LRKDDQPLKPVIFSRRHKNPEPIIDLDSYSFTNDITYSIPSSENEIKSVGVSIQWSRRL